MYFIKNRKGFSLVELIVVIAILAVIIAVLTPALISYTENSRASKDISAMDELNNAIVLSASDTNVYDELVELSSTNNVSCYIDSTTDANCEKNIIKSDNNEIVYYNFGDDYRLLDETYYNLAGKMRGVTITFVADKSSNETVFYIKNGIVNKYITETDITLNNYAYLYNSIRQSIGDTITLNSQTYRNSEYTVFISIGTSGGNQSSAQDAIQIYGQFSGTNLPTSDYEYQTIATGAQNNDITDIVQNVQDKADELVENAKDYLDENGDEIKDAVSNTVNDAKDFVEENQDEIKDAASNIVNDAKDFVEENQEEIDDAKEDIKDAIGSWFNKWFN